jgi:hypothetical protein
VNEANYQSDAGLATLAYLAMLILFNRQAKRSRTPSGISRISRWTFLTQATVDSVSFAGHITFAILAEGRPSLSLTAPAFLACMLFVYEAVRLHLSLSIICRYLSGQQQFSVLIYQIQLPESATSPPMPTFPATANATPRRDDASPTVNSNQEPVALPDATQQPAPLPTPVTQTASNNTSRSFISFLIHHIRTDAQARLCMLPYLTA